MRIKRALLLITVLAIVLAPSIGLACDKHGGVECSVKACPKSAAKAATLASNAEAGCQKSAASLVAMAKESGCPN